MSKVFLAEHHNAAPCLWIHDDSNISGDGLSARYYLRMISNKYLLAFVHSPGVILGIDTTRNVFLFPFFTLVRAGGRGGLDFRFFLESGPVQNLTFRRGVRASFSNNGMVIKPGRVTERAVTLKICVRNGNGSKN